MKDYLQKVIEFTKEGLELHEDYDTIAFDPGMRGLVVNVSESKNGIIDVTIDFINFIGYNSKFMKCNWEDSENPKIKRKWNQTKFYPKSHTSIVTIYEDLIPFVVV